MHINHDGYKFNYSYNIYIYILNKTAGHVDCRSEPNFLRY